MRYLSIIVLFIANTSLAEISVGEEMLLKENKKLDENIVGVKKQVEDYTRYIENEKERLAKNKQQHDKFKSMHDQHVDLTSKLLAEIHASHDKLGVLDKKFSRQAKLFKCVEETLKARGHIFLSECKRLNPIKLTSEEDASLKRWEETLPHTKVQLNEWVKLLETDINKSGEVLERYTKHSDNIKLALISMESTKEKSKVMEAEFKSLHGKPAFRACNATTPVINLEEEKPYEGADFKGAFFRVPRDNQDGMGTCYANTTRNLLIGISGGAADASYLDIALTYKKAQDAIANDGLDGGMACTALEEIRKKGYCPQKLAPFESGEQNPAFESLLGKKNKSSHYIQSQTINLLKDFINSKQQLGKKNPLLSVELARKAQWMIQQLKSNPRIKLPLPVARVDIPSFSSLRWTFFSKIQPTGVEEKKFIEDYRDGYKKFYPTYLKSLLNKKTREEIFVMFKADMAPFIEKYKLQDSLAEWLRVFLITTKEDYTDPKYHQSLKDSLAFLKSITGKEAMNDDEFLNQCVQESGSGLDFVGKLQPLLTKLKEAEVNSDILFDKEGNLLSAADLMQLAVAPGCIHPENRKQIPVEFTCSDGYDLIEKIKKSENTVPEQIEMLRERVLMGLLKGYPLGNSYMTGANIGHINTIVGLRFNPEKKSCEYLLRESQDGTSKWESEMTVYKKIIALTEVRKK
ncbi:MAG TPA: hypothetical protein VNJ08_14305 [Bacteriovoracaceae bacterium]|nr:hypothetical protein [Bacteriovoracaceae bacterium]